jgi:hypothetical protein
MKYLKKGDVFYHESNPSTEELFFNDPDTTIASGEFVVTSAKNDGRGYHIIARRVGVGDKVEFYQDQEIKVIRNLQGSI